MEMKEPATNFNPETLDNLFEGFQLIGHDWRYIYLNEAAVKQSRYKNKVELIGFTMMEKFPGIEKTKLFDTLEVCHAQQISTEIENEFLFPDGSIGWFELRIEPVPEGIFILSIDITKRKQAEAERLKYVNGLERMLQMTSHRVRQPVANILNVSNFMDLENCDPNDFPKMVGYLKESALSLDSFIKELTTLMHNMKMESNSE